MIPREAARSAAPPPDVSVAGGFAGDGSGSRWVSPDDFAAPEAGLGRLILRLAGVAEVCWGCFLEGMNGRLRWFWRFVGSCLLGLLCAGCETYGKADWKARVGSYTWDQAIEELGPPESEAKTSDGSRVADWVISRSRTYSTAIRGPMFWSWSGQDVTTTAEAHLLLTFNAQGRLKAWKRIYK